jgi:peptidoglycan/LPS O-acetylase OafA/YrhL
VPTANQSVRMRLQLHVEREELAPTVRRTDIQGLRAVAVGLVVLAHAGVPGVAGGFVGVDVFFVLSGFLITTLLVREGTLTGRVSIAAFYARRARRILPAATVVLLSTLLWATYRLPSSRAERVGDDALWSVLFGANLRFGREGTDYFAADLPPSPLQHYWSLSVEEQFYLVWPLLVVAVLVLPGTWRRRTLAGVLAVACVGSFALAVRLSGESAVGTYFATGARVWELSAGALLALAGPALRRTPLLARHLLTTAGIGGVTVAATLFGEPGFDPVQTLLAVLGTVAVLAAGCGGPVGPARWLAARPVQWTGGVSYSLYLWHWPVLVLGGEYADGSPSAVRSGLLVVLAIVLAAVTRRFVEQPFQGVAPRRASVPRGLVLWPVAVGLAGAGVVWSGHVAAGHQSEREEEAAAYYATEGRRAPAAPAAPAPGAALGTRIDHALALAADRAPLPLPLTNLGDLETDNWEAEIACRAGFVATSSPDCVIGDRRAQRVVAAVGDSHMGMWLPALDELGKRQGFRVVVLVKFGCPLYDVPILLRGDPYPSCRKFRDWARAELTRLDPDVVVMAAFGLRNGSTDPQVWAAAVRGEVDRVQEPGAEVIVLSDVTELGQDPGDCLSDTGSDMASCVFDETERSMSANAMFERAARAAGARYADLTRLVCRHGRCPMVVDRTVTYRDNDHVSVTWARAVAADLGRITGLAAKPSG